MTVWSKLFSNKSKPTPPVAHKSSSGPAAEIASYGIEVKNDDDDVPVSLLIAPARAHEDLVLQIRVREHKMWTSASNGLALQKALSNYLRDNRGGAQHTFPAFELLHPLSTSETEALSKLLTKLRPVLEAF